MDENKEQFCIMRCEAAGVFFARVSAWTGKA